MERKQFLRYMGAALGWVAIAPLLTACDGGGDSTTDTTLPPATTPPPATPDTTVPPAASTLSAEEIAGLKFMREEEKLAHDVYVALYGLWGDNIFNQISFSETTHTEAVLALLVKYGIPDPAAGNPAGVFTDPALQPYSTPGDVANLLFFVAVLALVGVGYLTRPAGSPAALSIVIGLLSWDTTLPVPIAFGCGLLAAAVLVAYIPLTHMSHFIGKYFTYHTVRWDDAPLQESRRLAAAMAAYLSYKPTWAAGHIKGEDGATWAQVVTSRPAGDAKR